MAICALFSGKPLKKKKRSSLYCNAAEFGLCTKIPVCLHDSPSPQDSYLHSPN